MSGMKDQLQHLQNGSPLPPTPHAPAWLTCINLSVIWQRKPGLTYTILFVIEFDCLPWSEVCSARVTSLLLLLHPFEHVRNISIYSLLHASPAHIRHTYDIS